MDKKIKILAKKLLYQGFNKIYAYDLAIASMDQQKAYRTLHQREVIQCFDSVFVLIYVPLVDSFILCQEFRVGVFCNRDQDDAYIYECVAGMIDKHASPEQIACAEVYEEAGIQVTALQQIAMVYASPGRMTEKTYVYYTEVGVVPNTGLYGLASEGEEIRTQLISRKEIYKMMDDMKIIDSMTLLALNWFRATYG